MSGRLSAVKGMNDLLPEESHIWQRVEAKARHVFGLYSYEEVRTPIVEPTALFVRGIGEDTDVVSKEMYTFTDRSGDLLTLRPEGTASTVRAYVQHDRHAVDPIQKWFYLGPMFRRERPQKGRYRQFHQIGAELFGVADPKGDVEMIAMLHRFLSSLGVKNLVLQLNSLGEATSRAAYREALVSYFTPHAGHLGETDLQRLQTTPLRLLDSKDPVVVELSKDAPSILDSLDDESRAHFDAVQAGLTALEIPFEINPRIVRGLDYYSRTTFEFIAQSGLGAQSTVAGGGRYDALVEQMGGQNTPAIGFALGVERLILLLEAQQELKAQGPELFIAVAKDADPQAVLQLAEKCRSHGLRVELSLRPASVAAQMRRANRMNAQFAVVIGSSELGTGEVRLKSMESGSEETLQLSELANSVLAARQPA